MMYQTDYVISWDFTDADKPVVSFSKVYAEKETAHLMCDVLGCSYERTGVVSLRQLLSEKGAEQEPKEGADHE